jgi:hypothetical protein
MHTGMNFIKSNFRQSFSIIAQALKGELAVINIDGSPAKPPACDGYSQHRG